MKNKRLLGLSAAFALTLAIGATSCKKDKDDNNGSSSGPLSATIGVNAFKPQLIGATLENKYFEVFGGQTLPGDSVYLTVTFADTVALNTKLSVKGLQIATFTTSKIYSGYAPLSHGSITVTTLDKTNKKIAGKFEGVIYEGYGAKDSMIIKDGQFNIAYVNL